MLKEFENILGYEDIVEELERIVDRVKNSEKYSKFNIPKIHGVLLSGEAGVGKTTMAMSLIKALGADSIICRKDKPNGEFVKEIKTVFDDAVALSKTKNSLVCVLLDDMDHYSSSECYENNADEYVNIQTCIDMVKNENILVIGTINSGCGLPNSLLRAGRFDIKINVPCPKEKDAAKIIKHYLDEKKYIGEVNIEELARILHDRSAAELETIIADAASMAAYNNHEKIEYKDLIDACVKVLFDGTLGYKKSDNPYALEICTHEAGHAVVAELLRPGSVNIVSICSNSDESGGVCSVQKAEYDECSLANVKNRIMIALAGKAATEIVYNKADVGGNSDTRKAGFLINRIIDDYTESGFSYFEGIMRSTSESLLSRKEDKIFSELDFYYQKVKEMLLENKKFLTAVANAIFDKGTITQSDIKEIRAMCY